MELPPSSPLVAIAVEELRKQRTFLSSDEAAALTLPADTEDEEDLALDRVRRRRVWIYPAMRDRFIAEGRPFDEWQAMIEADEEVAGGETLISGLARQVLEWSIRSGDRAVMLGGFGAKAMRFFGVTLVVLAGWSQLQGAAPFVVGTPLTLGLLLVLGAAVIGRRARARGERLVAGLRRPPDADAAPGAGAGPVYETESA